MVPPPGSWRAPGSTNPALFPAPRCAEAPPPPSTPCGGNGTRRPSEAADVSFPSHAAASGLTALQLLGAGRGLPPPIGTRGRGHGSIRAAKGREEDGAGPCVCRAGDTTAIANTAPHGQRCDNVPPWSCHGAPAPHSCGAWGRPYSRPQGRIIRAPHPSSVVGRRLPAAGAEALGAGGAAQSGGWTDAPVPPPHAGRPLTANRCRQPQHHPKAPTLSDGYGWETPCRGGAAVSPHRWRQAGDGDVTNGHARGRRSITHGWARRRTRL